jgi:glycosyltransferase involved in cell wall biosynthesis
MPRRVCIVSPGNLASNPRMFKEAGALQEAGYEVTTVVCDYTEALRDFDREIGTHVPWQVVRTQRSPWERYSSAAARLLAKAIHIAGTKVPAAVAARAYGGPVGVLQEATLRVKADLYIAHYIAALPAASAAAREHGAMLGFDAEDFHSGEVIDGPGEPLPMKMVDAVEGALLPSCSYVTAAAPMIAKAYASRYGVPRPTTILNVFPLDMAPQQTSATASTPIRAYWFSQTVGLDRGLQAFLQAMAQAKTRIALDIRGGDRAARGGTLLALARELGIADRVRLLPVGAPQEMVRLAAAYDLGLSLETDVSESRRLCLTNKIFTYLLAGVPVVLSDTPAQRALAPDLGAAALVVSLAAPDAMAVALDRFVPALAAAKAEALRLGRERYNWEVEKKVLLQSVAAAFANRSGAPACRH